MAKTKELMYICTNNNNSIVESMFQRLNKIFSNEYVLNKLSTHKIANFARSGIKLYFLSIDDINKPSKEDKYCNKIEHWLDVRNQEMKKCLEK